MTTPHDKAIQAAANGIQWTQDCTFETIAENVVRDYFSSIGGIVVPREPTSAMISAYCELQNGLGINAFATDGYPRPYILVHTCRRTRQEVLEYMGESWAVDGETWRKGWKRAYSNGFRAIRVVVRPFGSAAPLDKGGE